MLLSSYIYALVSNAAYGHNSNFTNRLPGLGWERLALNGAPIDQLGYHGVAYACGNIIIIGHRGTLPEFSKEAILNLMADAQLFLQSRPNLFWEQARKFSEYIRQCYPSHKIMETGHSLGGVYAALNACYFGTRGIASTAVTFDNPGIGGLIRGLNHSGVGYNPVNTQLVTILARRNAINAAGEHIGECYYIQTPQAPKPEGMKRIVHIIKDFEPWGQTLGSHSLEGNILQAFNDYGKANFRLVANESWGSSVSHLLTAGYYLATTGYAAPSPTFNHQASLIYC